MNNVNSLKKISILIVDDNSKMRMIIRKMVESQFKNQIKKIHECANGKIATELYEKHKPYWTLMDIKMPVMDGFEASKIILKSNPKAKILILTQYDDIEYYELARKIGVTAFVLKENLSDVPALIKNIL